jgi:hypothetical protein
MPHPRVSRARRLIGSVLLARGRLLLGGALMLAAIGYLPIAFSGGARAQGESPPANEVELEPRFEAQVSILANRDQDYTSLDRTQAYAQAYLRTAGRNSAWVSYRAAPRTLAMECSQAPETVVGHLPIGLEYRAPGKQVLFEHLGGYPSEKAGTMYCQNVGNQQSAAYLTGVGAAELTGPAAIRLDLTRGQVAQISVLRGRVLFTPSGEVPWPTESMNVEAGQSVTLDLAAPRRPASATYEPSDDDRETFEALRQRVLRAAAATEPTVPGRITVDDPSPLAFGSQPVGALGQPKFVLVANRGQTSADMSARSLTPDFRVESGSCPPNLGPDGSCAISVTFIPAGHGIRSGTLEVSSSSLPRPFRIPLSVVGILGGTGSPPFR